MKNMKITPTEEVRIFQAVTFTRSMIEAGNSVAAAASMAASKFNVDRDKVEKLVAVAIQECKKSRETGLE
jgi:hypothetical protein